VIAHGVYSWVPHETQAKILDIGRRQLTANGIQFVSYNTYPGWHLREAVRNMMLYHAEAFESSQDRIQQARALLNFLAESSQSQIEAYPALLKQELERLQTKQGWYIYHEHLEKINEPLYFHQFVKRVDTAGLRFLAESSIREMSVELFGESTAELLRQLPLLQQEQYNDFLRARQFRASLLCKPDVRPNYNISPKALLSLDIRLARPLKAAPGANGETTWTAGSTKLSTRTVATGVLERLQRNWPCWEPVLDLVESTLRDYSISDDVVRNQLLSQLLGMFVRRWVELAKDSPEIVRRMSDTPRCSPLARLQARHKDWVTNRHHVDLKLDTLSRFLLQRLDGTQTVGQLTGSVLAALKAGQLNVASKDGKAIEQFDPTVCEAQVKEKLTQIAFQAFLVG
jgi:methyltransferase-like protein